MEIVAMEMNLRGMYTARLLSFEEVTFKIDEVVLTPKFIQAYDESVKLWVDLLQSFTEAAELVNAILRCAKQCWHNSGQLISVSSSTCALLPR